MMMLTVLAAASNFIPAEPIGQDEDGLSGEVAVNASSASGNTNKTVIGGNFRTVFKEGAITHAFEAGGNYTEASQLIDGEEETNVIQNRWFAQYRGEIQTGDRTFLYGRLRYDEDQFSGFDRQVFAGGGIGHAFFKSKKRELTIITGPGYQYLVRQKPNPVPADFQEEEGQLALFVGQTFRQVLRENVTFEQSFDATLSDQNKTLIGNMALKTDLTDKISSRISYNVIHNTEPPEGREQTDTLLTVSLGYEF
jgi:putative salt-induced outer membrane protein